MTLDFCKFKRTVKIPKLREIQSIFHPIQNMPIQYIRLDITLIHHKWGSEDLITYKAESKNQEKTLDSKLGILPLQLQKMLMILCGI